MEDCLFCRIANGDIPTTKMLDDEHTVAFADIDPQAPTHILVVPKAHYTAIHEIPAERMNLVNHLFSMVNKVVAEKSLASAGYRLVVNSGENSGQSVPHIHVHILSGRPMQWPPG